MPGMILKRSQSLPTGSQESQEEVSLRIVGCTQSTIQTITGTIIHVIVTFILFVKQGNLLFHI